MRIVDRLVFKSFLGPFSITFFISLFVFLMQFLWKYIDDLVGKGLENQYILELLFYASATLVPMALPLAVLLASIMTFGNMGEHYELVSLKSSGVSLFRIMLPLIIFICFVSMGAFWFSNNVLPAANLKYYRLLQSIRHKKPALDFKANKFNNSIDGYTIKIGSKGPEGRMLYDIMVYDHTSGDGNTKVILAEEGEMYVDGSGDFLMFKMQNGSMYEEVVPKNKNEPTYEHSRTEFKAYDKVFDLSIFKLDKLEEDLFKKHYFMLNISQLNTNIDSIEKELAVRDRQYDMRVTPYYTFVKDTTILDQATAYANKDTIFEGSLGKKIKLVYRDKEVDGTVINLIVPEKRKAAITRSLTLARSVKTHTQISLGSIDRRSIGLIRHKVEKHRKFTLSIACLVLFFIGAPLGAIIRKGGLGLPMVFSVVFFIVFHVLTTMGKKMADDAVLSPFVGMWLAIFILFPIGVWLTYKSMNDSALFNMDAYVMKFNKLFKRKEKIKANNEATG